MNRPKKNSRETEISYIYIYIAGKIRKKINDLVLYLNCVWM